MTDRNFITFRIRYHVKYEEAVYIVLDCQQMNKYPVKMECNEMDNGEIWEVVLQFQEDRDYAEQISYYYQVADFHNQNFVKYPITWENSSDLMVRKFTRQIYLNKSVIIFDQCKQRNLSLNSIQDEREIRDLTGKLIKINLCIKKKVSGQGRWIYGMPMPDRLFQNFSETDFLKAVKLQRIRTNKPNLFYWKKIWVFTFQQYEQLGGSTNFAFFESFYYRRKVSDWIAVLPNGQSAPLAQIAKMLEQSDTPFQIQVIDESNGEVIQSISYKTQDLYKQNFIYQISDDLDPVQMFQVYLVFENLNLGRHKMTRRANNPRFWQVQVTLCKMDQQPLYYFDVHNVIDAETKQLNRTNSFRYSYPDQQNRSNINCYTKGSICQSHSYQSNSNSSHRYYSPPPTTSRRQIKSAQIYYTYPTHTSTKISNTTSYYYNRRPEYVRSKLWNQCRTISPAYIPNIILNSTTNNTYRPNSTTMINTTNFTYPSSTTSISINSPTINNTYVHNSSNFVNTNTNNTYHDYHNYFKDTYSAQSTSSNISSTSHITRNSYSAPIVTRTQRNVYKVLDNVNNYGDNVHRYYNNAKNLFSMPEQQIRYVKVRDFIDPIKLKLIKTSKIEQVSDKFEKATQNLIREYPEISQKFLELKDLRAQLTNQHKLQQQQIKKQKIKKKKLLFMIQLMTISKKWGKSKYNEQCQQHLYQILTKYNLISKQSQETIFWILYYINQQTITQKYNQIACTSTCNKCGKQAQFQQELKKIMKQIQSKPNIKEISKESIIKEKLYQNVIDCITGSYKELGEYALNKQLQLFKNNTQECLMRTLLNYAIIYSIGRRVFSTNLFGAFKDDCGPFGSFCREMNTYISVFKWQELQKLSEYLDDKNLELKQMQQKEITPLQFKIIQIQKQVVQQIQKTTNKELIDLVNVTIDLEKAKKMMQEKNKNELEIKCFINLSDDDDEDDEEFSSLQKEIEQIDNMQDEKERFVRIRSLKNNRFEKAGFKFD